MSIQGSDRGWPDASLARVPYWVYQDEANYRAELRRIFEGPTWSYVCLESDLERPGDYRTTFVGEMPVVVVRGRHRPTCSTRLAGEIRHRARRHKPAAGGAKTPSRRAV